MFHKTPIGCFPTPSHTSLVGMESTHTEPMDIELFREQLTTGMRDITSTLTETLNRTKAGIALLLKEDPDAALELSSALEEVDTFLADAPSIEARFTEIAAKNDSLGLVLFVSLILEETKDRVGTIKAKLDMLCETFHF